jgi:hypothetical protein
MRLRSGRIVKDQLVHPEEEETLSSDSSSDEPINDNISSEGNKDDDSSTSTTTMSERNEEQSTPAHMNAEQIQQAVQIAIAAIRATQPATVETIGATHGQVNGLKDAPRYNGRTDVRTWMRRYEAYAHAMRWNEADQLDALTVALEEAANDWLWSQERRDPVEEDLKDKLNRRKEGLVKRFGPILVSQADYTQLYALRQGNKETIDELLERLDAIERRLPEPAPEDVKKFAFISALRPQLRLEVEKQQVTTMDEATEVARRHEEILLRIYGPRKDATDTADSQTNLPRPYGTPRQVPALPGTTQPAYQRPMFPRYNGQTNGPNISPRQPLGGGPPRFPMGGGPPRPTLLPPQPRPVIPEMADKELEELVERFKAVKIGTAEHGEWQRWAMSTGRCYRCLRQGHLGRNCPDRMPAQRRIEYEDDNDEEEMICMEAESEEDPQEA